MVRERQLVNNLAANRSQSLKEARWACCATEWQHALSTEGSGGVGLGLERGLDKWY